MTNDFNTVLKALRDNMGTLVDDHNGKDRVVMYIAKFGEHTILLVDNSPYFCINPIVLDEEGKPHLSRWSVGGVVDCPKSLSLGQAITAYNESVLESVKEYAWVNATQITDWTLV